MKKKEAKHVRGIVDSLLKKWETGKLKKGNAVKEAWEKALEEEEKKHAHPLSLKKGVLMVIVEDSTWLYVLTLRKNKIIEKFNSSYTGRNKVFDIRFRVGSINGA